MLRSQWFLPLAEKEFRPLYYIVHGIYLILVSFFLHLKLAQMLLEVVRNTQIKFR